MTEEKWVIDTPDGKKIYGLLNKSDKKKNNKAILHVHGLTGSQSDYAPTRMALTLPNKVYDVIRFNLYYWEDDARSLFDCSIKQHAIDINTVFKYFSKKYKKIFATGHSYGGPSLITSKINQFNAVSLWDPSFVPSFNYKDFVKSGKYYIDLAGVPLVLSKQFIEEAKEYSRENTVKLSKKCRIPLQVLHAANGILIKEGESYHSFSSGKTDYHIIKNTMHGLYEEGSTEPLLRYVKKWFDQF